MFELRRDCDVSRMIREMSIGLQAVRGWGLGTTLGWKERQGSSRNSHRNAMRVGGRWGSGIGCTAQEEVIE